MLRHITRDEIGFRELCLLLWDLRWSLGLIISILTVGVAMMASVLPSKYSATVVLALASNSSLSGSPLGALAASGKTIRSNPVGAEAVGLLQSAHLAGRYIEVNDLLPVVFPNDTHSTFGKLLSSNRSLTKATEIFRTQVISLTEDGGAGILRLTATWTDPEHAARWANDLIRITNEERRANSRRESEARIQYLEAEAARTLVAELRNAIYDDIELERRKLILADATHEYAFKIIDPAVAPEARTWPRRTVWVLTGFLAGASLSLFLALLRAHRTGLKMRLVDVADGTAPSAGT
jgi:uncharacterized protein involved in exopolysaccharide biosynthesis